MPSTVDANVLTSWGVHRPFERKCFYAAGRYWVFYSDGTNVVFKSSPDNVDWSIAKTTLGAGSYGFCVSVWFDGTYVYYARASGVIGTHLYYRRGIPQSDGTINWSTAVEQVVYTSASTDRPEEVGVSSDSNGLPFVSCRFWNKGGSNAYVFWVWKCSTGDGSGTWTGYQLSTSTANPVSGSIHNLTNGKMYAVYQRQLASGCKGRLWDGTQWLDEETITTLTPSSYVTFCATTYGDDVYYAFVEATSLDIHFVKRTYGGVPAWGAIETILSGGGRSPAISINLANNNVYCFWWSSTIPNHIVYKKRSSAGVWDTDPTDWIDESTDGTADANGAISASYQNYYNGIHVTYSTRTATPWKVRYASLVFVHYKTITEYLGGLDTRLQVKSYYRTISELLGLLDSKSYIIGGRIYKTITEILGALDSKSKTYSLHRTLTELLEMKDTKSIGNKILHRIITESLGFVGPYRNLWFDDFEDGNVTEWILSQPNCFVASTAQKKNGLYSGKLVRTTRNSFNAYRTFNRQTGTVKFDLWVYIWDNGYLGAGEAFYLQGYDGETAILYLSFHNDHNCYWYDGTNVIDTGLDWVDKTWHHVVCEMDLATNYISLWIDDVPASSVGWRVVNPTGIDRIYAGGYVYDDLSYMFWDDVNIIYRENVTRIKSYYRTIAEFLGLVHTDFAPWGLWNWLYRKSHIINHASGAGTDYPVKLDLKLFTANPPNAPTYQTTPTYDGSGQCCHPDVLYFPNGLFGYKYWMCMTPYPNNNSSYEKPSVLACNDGKSWQVPTGGSNPIDPNVNADPDLLYNEETNELWCYYGGPKRRRSSNGITWSSEEPLNFSGESVTSSSFVKVGSIIYLFYRGGLNDIRRMESTDGINFTNPTICTMNGDFPSGQKYWHLNVAYDKSSGTYFALLNVCAIGQSGDEARMLFAKSKDGINWYLKSGYFLTYGASGQWDDNTIYRAGMVIAKECLRIWYSARKSDNTWHIGYTEAIFSDTADIHLNGKGDLSDVVFTDDDGVTLLECWKEYGVDYVQPIFWYKVLDDLSIANQKIFVYYNNPSATTIYNQMLTRISQLKEHDRYGVTYNPNFQFTKPTASKIRLENVGNQSRGDGYVFFVVPASWINGKYIRWSWNGVTDLPTDNIIASAFIMDGIYDRRSATDFPSQSAIPTKGNGLLQTLYQENTKGTWGPFTRDVLVNINPALPYVTLFFKCIDSWSANSMSLDIDFIEVNTSSNGVGNIVTLDFAESVVMEVTGTYKDYGLFRKYVSPEPSDGAWSSGIARFTWRIKSYFRTITELFGLKDIKSKIATLIKKIGAVIRPYRYIDIFDVISLHISSLFKPQEKTTFIYSSSIYKKISMIEIMNKLTITSKPETELKSKEFQMLIEYLLTVQLNLGSVYDEVQRQKLKRKKKSKKLKDIRDLLENL